MPAGERSSMITGSSFKSLYINRDEKKLVVNGTELPYEGITEFLLTIQHDRVLSYWALDIQRDALIDFYPVPKALTHQEEVEETHQ